MTFFWLLRLLLLLEGGNGNPPDDDDDDTPDDDEEIRDPQALIKSLKQANSRLSKKLRKRDERIRELESDDANGGDELRTARLENAFLRAAIERPDAIDDLDTAWTLAETKGFLDSVKVGDDGTVEGMPKALDKLCDRYPYLVDLSDDEDEEITRDVSGSSNTGRTPRPPKPSKVTSQTALAQRFPALRGRRRGRPRAS